jgi:nanoRNase/pAp phosphatase (c-di-AMP/oligoRNAs hydrolase)
MLFTFNGSKWVVSLYTKNPDIDVSEIAYRYGGGGHKAAAGFVTDDILKIINNPKKLYN